MHKNLQKLAFFNEHVHIETWSFNSVIQCCQYFHLSLSYEVQDFCIYIYISIYIYIYIYIHTSIDWRPMPCFRDIIWKMTQNGDLKWAKIIWKHTSEPRPYQNILRKWYLHQIGEGNYIQGAIYI